MIVATVSFADLLFPSTNFICLSCWKLWGYYGMEQAVTNWEIDITDQRHGQSPSAAGQCLCGSVRSASWDGLRAVVNCYCGQCRRVHGSKGTYTQVASDALVFETEEGLAGYRSSGKAERGLCRTFGSSLFWCRHGGDRVSITAGNLEQPSGLKASGHIYTCDLADFLDLPDDGLPRFETTSAGKLDGDRSS